MSIIKLLLTELEQEAPTTRKMLERVPSDKFDWKPHQKSMSLHTLATHVAELPTWITMGLRTSELDFASGAYQPTLVNNTAELLNFFEKSLVDGRTSLSKATEEDLWPTWTLRTGDQVHAVMTKYEVIRHAIAQIIHHRAQLGVYLRILNIPIPGSYGPSADELEFADAEEAAAN